MKLIGIIVCLVGLFIVYQGISEQRCNRQVYGPYPQYSAPVVVPVSSYPRQQHGIGANVQVNW